MNYFPKLKSFLFPSSHIRSILSKQNLNRMLYFAPILSLIHIIHIIIFAFGLDSSNGKELLWKKGILYSHISGLLIALLSGILSFLIKKKNKTDTCLNSLVQYIQFFFYIGLASVITAIDQYVTTSITPFLVVCTGLATVFIIPAGFSIFIYLISYVIFINLMSNTQHDLEALLSIQVNGITITLMGIAISIILYSNTKVRIIQDQIIASQKKDLKKKNSELILSNKTKSEFLSIAAHDLKNPLSVILSFSTILLESEKMSDSSKEKVFMIIKSAGRMLHLVTKLLIVNKMELQKIHIDKEVFDMNSITNDVIQSLISLANSKNQKIITDYYSIPLLILADKFYLFDAIENLLSNSIKYSNFDKPIYIKTFKDNNFACIEIKDEGPGLSEEDQEKLFKRFAKLSSKPTGNESSNGLGLFIVKKLTEAMNGKITYSSKKGYGSSFILHFPIMDEVKNTEKELSTKVQLNTFVKTKKILVVDDDNNNINLMKFFLNKYEIQPILASSGKEALEVFQNNDIDIVFLDMQMPEMDGLATKAAIQEMGKTAIFILCTADSFESDRALELGFDETLEKPIDLKKLKLILEKLY